MDIDVLREQLEREIAAADEAIHGRETQIAALKQENEGAVARIEHAREALAVLDQLIAKLEVLGPLATEAVPGDQTGKRVPQKKIVDPIVAGAERSGITVEEMIALAKRSHGVDLKPASLKSLGIAILPVRMSAAVAAWPAPTCHSFRHCPRRCRRAQPPPSVLSLLVDAFGLHPREVL